MPYKALRFDHVGTLGDLHFQSLSLPRPSYGEVLVEVHAAGINPSDVQGVLGRVSHTTVPRTPGRDFAGVVVEGPEDLLGLAVWGTGGELGFARDGSHAELLLLPREAVSAKPEALTMLEAATVGVPYVKAYLGLSEAAGLMAGETVVVVGGGGDVGMASVHLAQWMGARVIGLVISDEYAARVREAGAECAIDMTQPDWFERAREAIGPKGADVVMDCLGGTPFEPRLALLGRRGRLVALATTDVRRVSFDLLDFFRRELRLLGVNSLVHDARTSAAILDRLTAGFESGALRALEATVYPLSEAIAAYQDCNMGTVRKAVLSVKPD